MKRLSLDLEQLEVVSFEAETDSAPETVEVAGASGVRTCLGWYSCYVKCFGTVVTYNEYTCAYESGCCGLG